MSRHLGAALLGAAFLGSCSAALAAPTLPPRAAVLRQLERRLSFAALRRVPARDTARLPLAGVLRAHARVLEGIALHGNAGVGYWMRVAYDQSLVGNAVELVLRRHDEAFAALPVTERVLARRLLARLRVMQVGGTGDVYYWLAEAERMRDELGAVAVGLEMLAERLDLQGSEVSVAAAAALEGTVMLVDLVPVSGTGLAEFWLRTCYDQVENAHAVAAALDLLAADLDEPIHGLFAEEIAALRALRVHGTGDAHYWLSYAQAMSNRLRGHEELLGELVQELQAVHP